MTKDLIKKLKQNENLTCKEVEQIMHEIMAGQAEEGDIAEFLLALREKGPTIEEITGAAKIMHEFVLPIDSKYTDVLDTCGTGGDKKNTFNISTLSALVVAGAGVPVAKHGNRSVSSKCGSADILEALGLNLALGQKDLTDCLNECGIAFLFAQKLHPAMKNVAPVRKQLGVETIFNILGPLTNPAKATHQMIGVYSRELIEPMATVLKNLGLKKAIVVHGSDGLDEITTTGKSFISEYNGQDIVTYDILPEELGIAIAKESDLVGGELDENVQIALDLLEGKKGPKRDIVLLNAAYALYTAEAKDNIEDCLQAAIKSIDSGSALSKLNQLKKFTNNVQTP